MRTPIWLRLLVLVPTVGLYTYACTLPAVMEYFVGEASVTSGLGLLLFGWSDGARAWLPWGSNILWLVAVVLLASGRADWAWRYAAVGVLAASMVLFSYASTTFLAARDWWLFSYAYLTTGSVVAWRTTHRTGNALI